MDTCTMRIFTAFVSGARNHFARESQEEKSNARGGS